MPLWFPRYGPQSIGDFVPADTSSTGVGVTTDSAADNTKGSYFQLIASAAKDAYGILIVGHTTFATGVVTSYLLDIAIGADGSEVVLIPNLQIGYRNTLLAGVPEVYYFPLYIPAGTRISARGQSGNGNGRTITATVMASLLCDRRNAGDFVGQRVTAYGVQTGAPSRGADVTASGTINTYGTTTNIGSTTANPIKYMQVGLAGGGALLSTTTQFQAKLIAGATIFEPLRFTITSAESMAFSQAPNFSLSQMSFDLPAGTQLQVALMASVASGVADFSIYGVD